MFAHIAVQNRRVSGCNFVHIASDRDGALDWTSCEICSKEEIAASQIPMRFVRFSLLLFAVFGSAAAFGQIPYPNPINHVIIIYQENRSLDNLFGSNSPKNKYNLPGLDFSTTGKANKVVNGVKTVFTVNAVPIPLASTPGSANSIAADDYDPDHSHKPAWLNACDAPEVTDPSTQCAMDGFNHVNVSCPAGATGCPGPTYPTYAYVRYKDVVPYFQVASQYGYANYMFQTNQGPSYPAHQFIFGGTSQAGVGSEPTWFVAENMIPIGQENNGCVSPSTVTVAQVDPATQTEIALYPCFTHTTLVDLFADHTPQITWTYYTPGEGAFGRRPTLFRPSAPTTTESARVPIGLPVLPLLTDALTSTTRPMCLPTSATANCGK